MGHNEGATSNTRAPSSYQYSIFSTRLDVGVVFLHAMDDTWPRTCIFRFRFVLCENPCGSRLRCDRTPANVPMPHDWVTCRHAATPRLLENPQSLSTSLSTSVPHEARFHNPCRRTARPAHAPPTCRFLNTSNPVDRCCDRDRGTCIGDPCLESPSCSMGSESWDRVSCLSHSKTGDHCWREA